MDSYVHAPAFPGEALQLALALVVIQLGYTYASGRRIAVAIVVFALAGTLYIGQPMIPTGLALVGVILALRARLRHDRFERTPREFFTEILIVFGGLAAYMVGRWLVESDPAQAEQNARRLMDLERAMGLWFEPSLQEWFRDYPAAISFFNGLYSYGFLALVVSGLVWLYLADPANYRLFRNALGLSVVIAIVLIILVPMAPPRLMPESGMVDTIALAGRERAYANDYAAIPSLHVGWIALLSFVIARHLGGWRWAPLTAIPAVLMSVAVIVTGNHYWLDGAIGAAVCIVPALVLAARTRRVAVPRSAAVPAKVPHPGRTFPQFVADGVDAPRARASVLAMTGLLTYLLVGQFVKPGFMDFWGYFIFQVSAGLVLLILGEALLKSRGGLSLITHTVIVATMFADVLGTDADLYARIDEYDKLTHFLGVAAVTLGCYELLRAIGRRPGSRMASVDSRFFAAVSIGIAAGVGWEVYEWMGDAVFQTKRVQSSFDTFNDLIFDALGALAAGLLARRHDVASGAAEVGVTEIAVTEGDAQGP